MTVTFDVLQVITFMGIIGMIIIWITEARLNRKIEQCEQYISTLCMICCPTTSDGYAKTLAEQVLQETGIWKKESGRKQKDGE